jgi:hypothetical protein
LIIIWTVTSKTLFIARVTSTIYYELTFLAFRDAQRFSSEETFGAHCALIGTGSLASEARIMAQKAHVRRSITILSVIAIIFASKTQPFKVVTKVTGATSCISLCRACAASNMTWLAVTIGIGPESRITLILAGTSLQSHSNRFKTSLNI